jgi:hypothetical protein
MKTIYRTLSRCHDNHVDASGEELLDFLLLKVGVFIRRGNQEAISLLSSHRGDRFCHLSEERMQQSGTTIPNFQVCPETRDRAARFG